MTVADRIGVMDGGRLVQVATPSEIYEQPNSRWVAGFIGDVNLIEGRVVSSGLGQTMIESAAGERVLVAHPTECVVQRRRCAVALRPEKIQIDTRGRRRRATENCFAGA